MKPKRILIAGCGYVGARLAESLAIEGHVVTAIRRTRQEDPPGMNWVHADLTAPRTLDALPRDLDAVVFAASPSAADESGYRRIFVDGLTHLIGALSAHEHRPNRLIFTSSTAVYAQHQGEWVDETSATDPQRFNGRVLLEAEATLQASPIPGCVLRLGGIYGPGRIRAITQVRNGTARLHPGPPHYTNRIHRDDAAGALRHLLLLDEVHPVYLGVDHEPADSNEVTTFLAETLGLPTPPAEKNAAATRRAGSKRCRNARLVASGYRFEYPTFREGYRQLIDP